MKGLLKNLGLILILAGVVILLAVTSIGSPRGATFLT